MLFKDVLGQAGTKKILTDAINIGRVPHAQLLVGKEGQGGLALALAWSQMLVCENRQAQDSCGKCVACQKAAKAIHPDIHYTFPTISKGDGKPSVSNDFLKQWREAIAENPYQNSNQWLQKLDAENKQGNITKDECVKIVSKLSLKAFEAPYKILILWLPEYLGKEGNRLLKLIEEPPDDTYFMLVTQNEELILNTIISRCQSLLLQPLADADIINALIAEHDLAMAQAENIAYIVDGNYNEALSLVHQTDDDLAPLLMDWISVCINTLRKNDGIKMVQWSEKAAAWGREQQKYFFRFALQFLRECLLLKVTPQQKSRISEQHRERAVKFADYLTIPQIDQMTTLFNESYYHIERHANAKILWLDASLQIKNLFKLT